MNPRFRSSAALLGSLTLSSSLVSAAAAQESRVISEVEARRAMTQAIRLDARARAILERASKSYAQMQSLAVETRVPKAESYLALKREGLYQLINRKASRELISFAVCDGKTLYEYGEQNRQWIERDSALLKRWVVPPPARLFLDPRGWGAAMVGRDGRPAVREIAFRHGGREAWDGRPAEVLLVEILARAGAEWRIFTARRYFSPVSGLLIGYRNGHQTFKLKNTPNKPMKASDFRFTPVPGAIKALG